MLLPVCKIMLVLDGRVMFAETVMLPEDTESFRPILKMSDEKQFNSVLDNPIFKGIDEKSSTPPKSIKVWEVRFRIVINPDPAFRVPRLEPVIANESMVSRISPPDATLIPAPSANWKARFLIAVSALISTY